MTYRMLCTSMQRRFMVDVRQYLKAAEHVFFYLLSTSRISTCLVATVTSFGLPGNIIVHGVGTGQGRETYLNKTACWRPTKMLVLHTFCIPNVDAEPSATGVAFELVRPRFPPGPLPPNPLPFCTWAFWVLGCTWPTRDGRPLTARHAVWATQMWDDANMPYTSRPLHLYKFDVLIRSRPLHLYKFDVLIRTRVLLQNAEAETDGAGRRDNEDGNSGSEAIANELTQSGTLEDKDR